MIRSRYLFALAAMLCIGFIANADEPAKKLTNKVKDNKNRVRHFYDHAKLKALRANRELRYLDAVKLPPVALPIDYAKDLPFPMYGNDQYGDCFYASACHHDGTMTGNVGQMQMFTDANIINRYRILSGGDNGLADSDIQNEWIKAGLAKEPAAKILDYLYVKITAPADVQAAIHFFGGIQFTFAVPDRWLNNSDTGDVWDAPATPNQNSGHAVHFNGVDAAGRYKVQTWGTYVWITPAGVNTCDASGFAVFSVRWFNAKGYAPNGKHITELASLWTSAGGKAIPSAVIASFPPPSVDPPPGPVPPGPLPPTVAGRITIAIPGRAVETFDIFPAGSKVIPPQVQQWLRELLLEPVPPVQKISRTEPTLSEPATFTVHLPSKAKLFVDGVQTASWGPVREFTTPPLELGQRYFYELLADFHQDGERYLLSARVDVRAGELSSVRIVPHSPLMLTSSN